MKHRRVRQIVARHLEDPDAVEGVTHATHAHMQLDRLGWAMRVAADAMAAGDVRAIGPFIKAIDRLDRYLPLTRRPEDEDDQRRRLHAADHLVLSELRRRMEEGIRQGVARAKALEEKAAAKRRRLPKR